MKKIRWGIAGPGTIANKFALAIKNVECAELVAVASRTEENGRAFAEKYDIENVFVGYENMAKSDVIDAVYVATPTLFINPVQSFFLIRENMFFAKSPCV